MVDEVPFNVEVFVLIKLLDGYQEYAMVFMASTVFQQTMDIDFRLGIISVVHFYLLEQF